MGNANNQRDRILALFKILWENTSEGIGSEKTTLTFPEIVAKLAELKPPIEANRKTIYSDLIFLKANQIVASPSGKNHHYYSKHLFTVEELLLLSVAAASSPFLNDKSRDKIINHLSMLDAKPVTDNLFRNIQVATAEGTQEANTFNSLKKLQEVLKDPRNERKDVSFIYKRALGKNKQLIHNKGNLYRVFPIRIMYANDFFYLLAYRYDGPQPERFYRIDGMFDVEGIKREQPWSDKQREGISDLDDLKYDIRAFDIFWGESKKVKLEVPDKMMQGLVDRFGNNYDVIGRNKERTTVYVYAILKSPFFGWLCTYGVNKKKDEADRPGIQLIGPPVAVKAYRDYLKQVLGYLPEA